VEAIHHLPAETAARRHPDKDVFVTGVLILLTKRRPACSIQLDDGNQRSGTCSSGVQGLVLMVKLATWPFPRYGLRTTQSCARGAEQDLGGESNELQALAGGGSAARCFHHLAEMRRVVTGEGGSFSHRINPV